MTSLSDRPTPKVMQTAYQRWELASLEEVGSLGHNTGTRHGAEKVSKEVLQARDEGRQQGFQKGLKDGITQGLAEGRAQAQNELTAMTQTLARQLASVVASINTQAEAQQAQLAQQVLQLSLAMSKAMLKTSLKVKPELMLPLIRQALDELPSFQGPAVLKLNPEDLNLVSTALDEELRPLGWRCTSDEHIERGGCKIETASNAIDASWSTRWQRLQEGLGQVPADWLDA